MAAKVPAGYFEGFEAAFRQARGESVGSRLDTRAGPEWSGFRNTRPSYKSAASAPTCALECSHCSEQYLPKILERHDMPGIELHDDKRALLGINELVKTIDDDFEYIKEKITSYGNVIAKRWLERYRHDKRQKMLLQAKPDLQPRKYAAADITFDFYHSCQRATAANAFNTRQNLYSRYQNTILNPYLDLPTLLEDRPKLLALVQYRATYSPSEWLLFDWHQAKNVAPYLGLQKAYNPHCMVVRGHNFGALVQWDMDSAHKQEMIGYPAALLALKAQRELMRFLRDMISLILEGDLSAVTEGCEQWHKLAANNFAIPSLESPVLAFYESPFRPPPQFNCAHLVEIFQSRMRAAEDDLWLLQTDPIWFRNVVNRTIRLVQSPTVRDPDAQHVVLQTILRSLAKLPMLRWIHSKLQRLCDLEQKACFGDLRKLELSEEYWQTLETLEDGVKGALLSEIIAFGWIVMSSTAFSGLIEPQLDSKIKRVKIADDLWKHDKLLWNVTQLNELQDPLHPMPASFHFSAIDELLAGSSSKDSGRIDQALYDFLSDLAAIEEVLSALKYHSKYAYTAPAGATDVGLMSLRGECAGVEPKLVTQNNKENDRLWKKLEQIRRLPKPSSKLTEEGIADSRFLQEALDAFWQEVHQAKVPSFHEFSFITEETYTEYIRDCSMGLNKDFKAQLEDDWNESLRALRAKETSCDAAPTPATSMMLPYNTFHQTKGADAITPAIPKKKTKTRPVQATAPKGAEEAVNDIRDLTLNEEPEKIFLAQKDSLEVFERIFSRSRSKHAPTKWPKFVAALQDAGLSASRSGGSAVRFSDKRFGKGVVGFHMPHPDSSIPLEWLREMGRRLNGWFGWKENSFVLRSKEDQ